MGITSPHSCRMTVDPSPMPRAAAASARVVGTSRECRLFAGVPAFVARRGKRSTAKGVAQIAGIAEIRQSPVEWASDAGLIDLAPNAQIAENPLSGKGQQHFPRGGKKGKKYIKSKPPAKLTIDLPP